MEVAIDGLTAAFESLTAAIESKAAVKPPAEQQFAVVVLGLG